MKTNKHVINAMKMLYMLMNISNILIKNIFLYIFCKASAVSHPPLCPLVDGAAGSSLSMPWMRALGEGAHLGRGAPRMPSAENPIKNVFFLHHHAENPIKSNVFCIIYTYTHTQYSFQYQYYHQYCHYYHVYKHQ